MAHTPGPWRNTSQLTVIDRQDNEICTLAIAAQLLEASDNARLIAAAPDLLAALVALVNPPEFDKHPADFTPEWHAARSAIAKAESTDM